MKTFLTDWQIDSLKTLKWDLAPDGFYIDLYRDEFEKDVWEQICDQANVEYDIDKLTLLCFGNKVNN